MEIEYTLDEDDHIAYWMYLWEQTPEARRPLLRQLWKVCKALVGLALGTLLLTWGLVILFYVAQELAGHAPAHKDAYWRFALFVWVGAFVVLALGVLGTPAFWADTRSAHKRKAKRLLAKSVSAGTLRLPRRDRVQFDANGFVETSEYHESKGGVALHEKSESHVSWEAIERIDLIGQHAIFIIRGKGALVLPRKAFPDEPAFIQFVEKARDSWQSSILASSREIVGRREQITAERPEKEGTSPPNTHITR